LWFLKFIISAEDPFRWIFDNANPDHVQIYAYHAPKQMLATFYGRRVLSVFPNGTDALPAKIIFLSSSTGYKLDGFRINRPLTIINHQQMVAERQLKTCFA
jgi:hypothetical protein